MSESIESTRVEREAAQRYEALNMALRDGDDARAEGLLGELAQLQGSHPQHRPIREMLAMGLFNTLATAEDYDDVPRRDALFERLLTLQRMWPSEEVIGKACAKALFGLLLEAERAQDDELLASRSADMQTLLDGLDGPEVPDDVMSPELLHWLTEGEDVGRDDDYWDQDGVPTLDLDVAQAQDHSVEAGRQALAKALPKAIEAAIEASDRQERGRLLGELSALHSAWPEDRYVASRKALGLMHALGPERAAGNQARVDDMLGEIHRIRDWLKATQG